MDELNQQVVETSQRHCQDCRRFHKAIVDMVNEVNHLTQLLCHATGLLRECAGVEGLDDRLRQWMDEHLLCDQQRFSQRFMERQPALERCEEERQAWIERVEKIHPLSHWHRTVLWDEMWRRYVEWVENGRQGEISAEVRPDQAVADGNQQTGLSSNSEREKAMESIEELLSSSSETRMGGVGFNLPEDFKVEDVVFSEESLQDSGESLQDSGESTSPSPSFDLESPAPSISPVA